jgi:methionine sulfoxide reductase heme-binding subunit
MTPVTFVRRVLKPLIWLAGLTPLAWLIWAGIRDDLTADPVKYITHFTGRTVLIILFVTLSITPIRRLTGLNALINARRLIGLFAFFYAVIHLLIYFVFDRGLVFAELGEDIAKRPYITVGFTAWLCLLALAVTSPKAMVRRLGGKRWQALHRLIYVAAILGVLHFTWAQKKDISLPALYGAVLAVIFAVRVFVTRRMGGMRKGRKVGMEPTQARPARQAVG